MTDAAEPKVVLYPEASFAYTQPTSRAALASLLHDGLEAAGHECTLPVDIDYAVNFRCTVDSQDFSILVGQVDDGIREWLVSTASGLRYWHRLWKTSDTESHRKLTVAVHRLLKADPLIKDLRWYTTEDWDQSPDESWKGHP